MVLHFLILEPLYHEIAHFSKELIHKIARPVHRAFCTKRRPQAASSFFPACRYSGYCSLSSAGSIAADGCLRLPSFFVLENIKIFPPALCQREHFCGQHEPSKETIMFSRHYTPLCRVRCRTALIYRDTAELDGQTRVRPF